jgi:hypothetical protein
MGDEAVRCGAESRYTRAFALNSSVDPSGCSSANLRSHIVYGDDSALYIGCLHDVVCFDSEDDTIGCGLTQMAV